MFGQRPGPGRGRGRAKGGEGQNGEQATKEDSCQRDIIDGVEGQDSSGINDLILAPAVTVIATIDALEKI